MMSIFKNGFGTHVCAGDKITAEHEGFTLVATLQDDDCQEAPWDHEDGHGPVSCTRHPRDGQRLLLHAHRHSAGNLYYDYDSALIKARREGWGVPGGRLPGESSEDYTERAVEADYQALLAWCREDWCYYGVALTVYKAGVELASDSVWGVEGNYPGSDNSHLREVANDLAEEALEAAREKLKELCDCP